ncbi:hypothetical protein HMI56_001451, partial [Coelomomyces lativittatus]
MYIKDFKVNNVKDFKDCSGMLEVTHRFNMKLNLKLFACKGHCKKEMEIYFVSEHLKVLESIHMMYGLEGKLNIQCLIKNKKGTLEMRTFTQNYMFRTER